MSRQTNSAGYGLLNVLQLISEIAIIGGFVLAFVPFMYLVSWQWVLPLTFINIFLAFLSHNRTTGFCFVNFIMALLSFIPIVGYVFRAAGIVISLLNVLHIRRALT